MRNLVEAHQIW